MLKHFRVNNFKNFKDDLDIDFSDVNGYKFSQDCITNDLIGKMIIYGKNGSGKTNLSKALCDLKETLTMSNDMKSNHSFISNANSNNEITTFTYTWYIVIDPSNWSFTTYFSFLSTFNNRGCRRCC